MPDFRRPPAAPPPAPPTPQALLERYRAVRARTDALCEPLTVEDHVIQCVPEASPARWHLAHTTWFFERFVLQEHVAGYAPVDEAYYFLFNSYYQALGPMHRRAHRGDLSRPTVAEIRTYRREVDARIRALLESTDARTLAQVAPLVVLGTHHEQQHQELLLTDLKINLAHNPLRPTYRTLEAVEDGPAAPAHWVSFEGGIHAIGTDGPGFAYDNEGPRHEVLLRPFALASRPTTNGEFLAFVEDGGYEQAAHWLDLGFARVRDEGWKHPLYWFREDGRWMEYTLGGPRPLALEQTASSLAYFEADAFARWAGHRLPTEAEWEVAAAGRPIEGNLADAGRLQTRVAADPDERLQQLFGDVWEWTSSAYSAYPGYRVPPGAVGEYNGKFMCNQYVLRGGSFATPRDHLRTTYRNFFPPEARWQFTGIRLAKDLGSSACSPTT